MTGRYIVRTQDDYFNVTDTCNNVPIVNGIRTEIEAEWLCNTVNTLNNENEILKGDYSKLCDKYKELKENWEKLSDEFAQLYIENKELKSEKRVDNIDWFKNSIIYVEGDEDKVFEKLKETAKVSLEKHIQVENNNGGIK